MKRWKRDLGIVRELGPDTREFDLAVARVWNELANLEFRLARLEEELREIAADPYPESERVHELQEIARRALA